MNLNKKLDALCTSREFEKKVIEWIVGNNVLIAFFVLTFMAILIRFSARNFESGDFIGSLSPWYTHFKTHGGFAALKSPIGDYNIPYQFLIALMTYIKVKPLYLFKILSCIFDFLLAIYSGKFVYYISSERTGTSRSFKDAISNMTFVLPYGVVLLLPTVVFNSALWGQCDAIYVFFIVLSLFLVYRNSYFLSFVFLGCAFAFKLQTVFILPFFFYLYFREKKFSILFLLFLPLVDILLSIPSLCMGLRFSKLIDVYINQADAYHYVYLNYPSFWAMIGDNYDYLKFVAIIVTLIILFVGLLYVIRKKVDLKSSDNFLSLACWSVWTCVLFLPSMHERYAYLVEVLIVIWFFVEFWSKDRKNLGMVCVVACVLQLITCMQYGRYLFNNSYMNFGLTLMLHTSTYIFFSYKLFVKGLLEKEETIDEF
ncbi:MAG: hypothetical protein K6E14_12125 [Paludibacteraceae bacterium]|nr:hypothetical protein [Paludibacteraceae bacterium]